jgi:hypothetical protein
MKDYFRTFNRWRFLDLIFTFGIVSVVLSEVGMHSPHVVILVILFGIWNYIDGFYRLS